MRCTLLGGMLIFLAASGWAQPVIDILQLQYQYQYPSVLQDSRSEQSSLVYFASQANIPLRTKNQSIWLLNPHVEQRTFEVLSSRYRDFSPFQLKQVRSYSMNTSYQFNLSDTSKSITLLGQLRHNASTDAGITISAIRPGFAVLYGLKRNESLSWKFGLYYARQFFGNFWLPLLGVDWRKGRWWCWGVLPRYAVIDFRIHKYWHTGFAYRGVNDSYALGNQDWMALFEGQARWFQDFYIPRSRLVLTAEIGHTLGRTLRGFDAGATEEIRTETANNLIFRAGISYRFTVNKKFENGDE